MAKKIKILLVTLLVVLSSLTLFTACKKHEHANFTNEKVVTAPTCTTDGVGSHDCAKCKETIEFVIPKLGHTEVVDKGVEPTCTDDGISDGKHCSTCNEVLVAQQVLPATHKPSGWQILQKATCDIDGLKVKVCTVCEERVDSETIKKLGHLEGGWQTVKPATCEKDGTKQTACSTCGEVMQTATIPATGHDESNWNVTKPATCLGTGTKQTVCLNCEEVMKTETIDATGHDESEWIVTQKATCENSGSKHTICNTCEEELSRETIEKLGHDLTDWITTTEPTCTTMGVKHKGCTRCNMTFDETTIEAKGHSFTSRVIEPTCTTDGYTENKCIRCPHTTQTDIVTKKGHEYTTTVTKSTCTKQGYTTYDCIRCDDTYNDDYTSELGHNYVKITEQPTCLTAGKEYEECSRCNDYVFIKNLDATGHSLTTNTYVKDMGNNTKRTATIYECGNCDYSHVRKIVFDYAVAPSKRINANMGYSYGMTVDYSDLTSQRVSTFRVDTNFTFEMDGFMGGTVKAHFYITSTGNYDKELGFISGLDEKVSAIDNSVGYIPADDDTKPWGGYVDFPQDSLKSNNVYFAFISNNYTGAFIVKTLTASATFDFGEPNL